MIKYIISSGNSVINTITDEISVTIDTNKALKFDTFGDAMRSAIKVNEQIGKPIYKVEILKETPVSSNL